MAEGGEAEGTQYCLKWSGISSDTADLTLRSIVPVEVSSYYFWLWLFLPLVLLLLLL